MGGNISDENTRFPITISKTLKERATFVAKCEHRSLSNLIISILSNYVDQHYSFYNILFEEDGTEKLKIDKEELKDISDRIFVLNGATGTGKSTMLDHLLKNMYYVENNSHNTKGDTV